jgi:ABC-type nitrate/sulfonate/bicarbonate transport system ATPase subunit
MAIVGRSGCGKCTLLKLIAWVNRESSGSILWNGRTLSQEGELEATEIRLCAAVQHRLLGPHRGVEHRVRDDTPRRDGES